jgi:hypothetical protein
MLLSEVAELKMAGGISLSGSPNPLRRNPLEQLCMEKADKIEALEEALQELQSKMETAKTVKVRFVGAALKLCK